MSVVNFDLLLKGGHIIDPANHIDACRDVAIKASNIARVAANIPATFTRTSSRSNFPSSAQGVIFDLGHSAGSFWFRNADVAVFKHREGIFGFTDCGRAKMAGNQKLECAMTLRAGEIVYDPTGLSMPEWQHSPESYWKIPDVQS